jgi:hypothetical protein
MADPLGNRAAIKACGANGVTWLRSGDSSSVGAWMRRRSGVMPKFGHVALWGHRL